MDISRDKKVDIAVAIIVGPGRTGHEAAPTYSGFLGHVFELAISKAAVKRIASETGDKDVLLAVIIEVGDDNSHAPPLAGQPSRARDVTELRIFILMVESNQRVATLAIMFNGGAIYHGNVQFAIVVAVKQADATAHRLDDIVLLGRGDMRRGQACLAGNVLELGRRRRWSFRLGHRGNERKEEGEGQDSDDYDRSRLRIRFVVSHSGPPGHPTSQATKSLLVYVIQNSILNRLFRI